MSNTPNLRHRRKVLMKHFRDSGEGAVNECKQPSRGASKAELVEFHREKVALQMARRRQRTPTSAVYVSTSIATGNRHGGEHLNVREIARRSRQSASPPPS